MRREEKNTIIDGLVDKLNEYPHFYLADTSALNAADTFQLRKKCFEQDIPLIVVKNTLLRKAFEKSGNKYEELYNALQNSTSIMFSSVANVPARLIKDFRKTHDKPVLKAAFVEESVYLGDDTLDMLSTLKSKEELLGEIIGLLQSPIRNLVSSLQSGGSTIAGLVKALSEKN